MAAGGVAEVLQAVQALHAHANPETTRQADESDPPPFAQFWARECA